MNNFVNRVLSLKTQTLWKVANELVKYYIDNDCNITVRCSIVHRKCTTSSLYDKILNDTDIVKTVDLPCPIAKININQLKLNLINDLFIVLFFADEIIILKYDSHDLVKLSNLYKFQHKDNINEAQFFFSELNIGKEIEQHLVNVVSYEDLENIIRRL